jgi:exo-beta-1,3-glucanase (GH17 family)
MVGPGLAPGRARDKPNRSLIHRQTRVNPMRLGLACLAASVLAIAAFWAWLGAPLPMPHSPLHPGEKLYCLSYAPFHGRLTPFDPATQVSAAQIDRDLTQLSRLTDCVRVYSTDQGLEHVAGLAAKHGLKVLQGVWLGRKAAANQLQIDTAVALANRYPDTIRALVVGNEVLLRGEMTAIDLANTIRAVKARVKVPVTYADVWEFWLRNPVLATAADFVTIHILPYWEDFPIAAEQAAAHVDAIRAQVVRAFPGKEVLIGEVGWPSAGRMREGALPSPANQARVIQDVLALAAREKFHVNVIEAYDQPWKRASEGTVGGHWGLIDDGARQLKFVWGEAVSNHPLWRWQAAGGVAFAVLVFGAALAGGRGRKQPLALWLAVTGNALAGGLLIGWTIENVPLESLGVGGWLRSLALAAVAFLSPPLLSAAITGGAPIPRFSNLIGPAAGRIRVPLAAVVGLVLIATMMLAVLTALGLVFNPRYKDFPFAPLTAAIVPFFLHTLVMPRPQGRRGAAEVLAAALLALSVPYIVLNESFANWQSLWLCAALLALAVSLAQVRDAQS